MFIRSISAALILAIATPALASGQSRPLSNDAYLELSRCAAYSTLPGMADERATAIAERAKQESVNRPAAFVDRASYDTRNIHRKFGDAKDVEAVKAKRDRACKRF
jgi:hypothetical protein